MNTRPKHRILHSRGTMLVEAAIVFPLLLMLTLGAIEYGWLFLNAQRVTNAARQGARVACVYGATETDVYSVIDALIAEARLSDDDPNRVITPCQIEDPNNPGDPNAPAGITVMVSVSTTNLAIVNAPGLLPIPRRLRAEVTMAKEGG